MRRAGGSCAGVVFRIAVVGGGERAIASVVQGDAAGGETADGRVRCVADGDIPRRRARSGRADADGVINGDRLPGVGRVRCIRSDCDGGASLVDLMRGTSRGRARVKVGVPRIGRSERARACGEQSHRCRTGGNGAAGAVDSVGNAHVTSRYRWRIAR